jgi:hypothetical protein
VPTTIQELNGEEHIRIHPNPSNGMVTVVLPMHAGHASTLEIIDASGRIVRTMRVPASQGGQLVMDLTGEAPGAYVVRATTQDRVMTTTLVLATY